MNPTKLKLIEAERIASLLLDEITHRQLIVAGKTEHELNEQVFELAKELFQIEKFWHKRIVRVGENTLRPYDDNPPNLTVQKDDILFFDFGPIIEEWEADLGRTYVIGEDQRKHTLKNDVEKAWYETKAWFQQQQSVTGAQLFAFVLALTEKYGWEYGGEIAGHLIGKFPHEQLEPQNYGLYIHPDNHNNLLAPDADGNPREWILEIHFVDRAAKIGGFFEQLLT